MMRRGIVRMLGIFGRSIDLRVATASQLTGTGVAMVSQRRGRD